MSLEAITAARKITGIHPRNKFVLMALADYANDLQVAWPSQATLAEWTCLTARTIRTALGELESEGYIRSTQRTRPNGSYTSKEYTLTFVFHPPRKILPPRAEILSSPEPSLEPPEEVQEHTSAEPTLFIEEEPDKGKARSSSAKSSTPDVAPYLAAWNANRGALASVKTLTSARARKLLAFIRECPDDQLGTFTAAVRVVAADDWWRKNRYGLDNLLVSGRVIEKAEAAEPASRSLELAVGDRVRFVNYASVRQELAEGAILSLDGDQVEVVVAMGKRLRIGRAHVREVLPFARWTDPGESITFTPAEES